MDDGASKAPTDNSQDGDPARRRTARPAADARQDDWVGHGPAAQPPAAPQPAVAQPPAVPQPTAMQPIAVPQPTVAQPPPMQPPAVQPTAAQQPVAVRPTAGQPAAAPQPPPAQPAAMQPAAAQPAAVRSVADDGQRATGMARATDPRATGESQAAGGADTRTFVVVTRAEADNGPLSTQLRELGLTVLLWPAVSVAVAETSALEEALENINTYDWIVFASRHAVAAVIERVETPPPNVRVAAVGKATGQVLRQRGWPVDLLPEDANAAALVSEFATKPMQGTRVLFPASSRALPTIAAGLTQLGATVTQVEAYRTEPASLDVDACRAWIERDVIAAVTFASPSAVIELEHALAKPHFDRLLKAAKVIAIGPTTARALEEHGCTPIMAETANLSGLAQTTFRSLKTRD